MDKLKALSYNEVKKAAGAVRLCGGLRAGRPGTHPHPRQAAGVCGLTREVVVIGSFDRAEIWDAERWAAVENDAFASGELESAMAEMGL